MSTALKWKLLVGFVLVFLAGGMTGAFFGAHFFFAKHHRGVLGERMRERLRAELKLTPEQVAKVSPVIDDAAAQLERIRIETGQRVHQTMAQMHRQMAADLTDEQRAKLERIQSRHRSWRGFHQPPPRSPAEERQE
jgi:Spy/CpxP family protein refolding chaperone